MVESVIRFLIWLALIVGCVFLVIWVLGELGLMLPAIVIKIVWIVAVLIVILFAYRTFKPYLPPGA